MELRRYNVVSVGTRHGTSRSNQCLAVHAARRVPTLVRDTPRRYSLILKFVKLECLI